MFEAPLMSSLLMSDILILMQSQKMLTSLVR